jgi:hypothetical protein
MSKAAVILLTHFLNDEIIKLYRRLCAELPPGHDVFININCGDKPAEAPQGAQELGKALNLFNTKDLLSLPFPEKCRPDGWQGKGWSLPGNEDLNFLIFYDRYPGYDYYWGIEYDVHYQGNWRFFFERFAASTADLIGTTLYRASATPNKILHPLLRAPDGSAPNLANVARGLYPVFRLSKRAAQTITDEYKNGWSGHYELAWGAIARLHNLEIEDIGGNGEYVKPHNRNAFYFNCYGTYTLSPGTFVFRPPFAKVLPYENTLWHPVKPKNVYNWFPLIVKGHMAKNLLEWLKPRIWHVVIRLWFLLCWRPAHKHPS